MLKPVNKKFKSKGKGTISRFSPIMPALRTRLFTTLAYIDLAASDYLSAVYTPTLAGFESYANYTAMFDQYRVMKLTFHFIPRNTTYYEFTATGTVPPIMAVAPEFDDTTAAAASLSGITSVMMKPGGKFRNVSGPTFSCAVVPRILLPTTTATVDASKTWISTATTDVKIYGFKFILCNLHWAFAHGYIGCYTLEADIEFRGQHAAQPGVLRPAVVEPTPSVKQGSVDEEMEEVEYVRVKRK